MKLRLYFRPGVVVWLLAGLAALVDWLAWSASLWLVPFALFYSMLFAVAAWAWWRTRMLERWMAWPGPERLLVLAPHEDDCVIGAGGIGAAIRRLGGRVRIVYLAPDESPGIAEVRSHEARAAWREAGVD